MRRIRPYLYVGPGILPDDVPRLRRAGVTAVLSLQEPGVDLLPAAIDRVRVVCEPLIVFHNISVRDYDPTAVIRALPDALSRLHDLVAAGRVVYVHCSEGINRSPSVALAYLVRHEKLTVERALSDVRRCHPAAKPYDSVVAWLKCDAEKRAESDA